MPKKSFILHIDSLSILDDLTDEQAGMLFKAIKAYQKNEDIELDQLIKIAFSPFKNQFARDEQSYESVVERNRINGLKGGRPKNQEKPKETQKTQSVISKPKKADSDSKNDSDNDKQKIGKFKPPTHEELKAYLLEKALNIDADQFIDFYESKGWYVGKNKMKCWKAAVRTWAKRGNHNEKTGNRSRADTAAEVGDMFEKEANAAARRLSESPNAEVQSYIPAKVGRTIQNH